MAISLGQLSAEVRADSSRFKVDLNSARTLGSKFANEFKTSIGNIGNAIGSIGTIGRNFARSFVSSLGSIVNFFPSVGNGIRNTFLNAFSNVQSIASNAFNSMTSIGQRFTTSVSTSFNNLVTRFPIIGRVGTTVQNAFTAVGSRVVSAFSLIGNTGQRVFSSVADRVGNVRDRIVSMAQTGWKKFNEMRGSIEAVAKKLKDVGASMTKYVSLPIAAAGIAIFKFGKDFEREMSKVVGLVGVAQDQVNSWGKDIIGLAPEIARTPQELAEALFFVTSAGIRGADAMEVLEMSGKAAAAGLGETKTIADLVTSAMNAYGKENLSAAKATDVVTAAVREGKAEASELAASLGQVLPLSSALGVSFDQVAATQAAMTKTGTPAAEAATQLKSIMAGLIKPSKQAEEQMKKMGTSASDMRKNIREKGLLKALMELRTMTNKYGEEAMARVFPNIRALLGVLDLMGSSLEGNIKTFDAVKNSTGMLDEAFNAASKTLDFKWNQAVSKVQATLLGFFDVVKSAIIPVLDVLMSVLDWVMNKFKMLPKSIQSAIVIMGGIAAILGPVLIALSVIITALVTVIGAIGTAISTVASIIGTVGLPAIIAIAAVLGIVIFAIVKFVRATIDLYKTNKDFREKVEKVWNLLKSNGIAIFNSLKDSVMIIWGKLESFWGKHGDTVLKIVEEVWDDIFSIVQSVSNNVLNLVELFNAVLEGDWDRVWNEIKQITSNVWQAIVEVIGDKLGWIWDKLTKSLSDLGSLIADKVGEWTTSFIDWGNDVNNEVANTFVDLSVTIVKKCDSIRDTISAKVKEWGTSIIEWFKSVPDKIATQLESWKLELLKWLIEQNEENKRQLSEWGIAIMNWFATMPEQILTGLLGWQLALGEWFASIPGIISEKLMEWGLTITGWFASIPSKISEKLVEWGLTITIWLNNMRTKFEEKVGEWWKKISGFFTGAPGKITKYLSEWWTNMKKWFEDTVKKIQTKLDEWWTAIKNWFKGIPEKPEVKNAGSNMINKMSQGAKDKKSDFMDKLGKIIVDVAIGALKIGLITLIATGREIVKRLIDGIKKVSLKSTGKKIIQSLVDGIKGMYGTVEKVCYSVAKKIRDYFPFSPAKKGPLMDIDKIDFSSSIEKSLNVAKSRIKVPSVNLGTEIMNNISKSPTMDLKDLGNLNNSKSNITLTGPMYFNGVNDVYSLMKEIRNTAYRYTGKKV